MKTYTLFELNEHIRRVLALNLGDAIWVSCEIAQLQISRGHRYLTLVQKEEDGVEIIAQTDATLWNRQYSRIQRKIGAEIGDVLQAGMEVMLLVKVDFHERYGLKYQIEDVDPGYTIGQLALQKRKVIGQLEKEQLLENNSRIELPIVLQKIAVISSLKAAGYQDFIQQLNENQYGYKFDCRLFQAAVQGLAAETEIIHQLQTINKRKSEFDCLVIVRGGGASIDLRVFDQLELCRTIAGMGLPVLTGVGHDIDQTIADILAHQALKTPTAAAEFILNRNMQYEAEVLALGRQWQVSANQILHANTIQLKGLEDRFELKANNQVEAATRMLDFLSNTIPDKFKYCLIQEEHQLEVVETRHQILSVENTLKRGYSITTQKGKILRSKDEIKKGKVTTRLSDGTFDAEVK